MLLLILASSLAALLLGEIGLRLMGQSYYWAFAKRVDPVLGWRPPPQSQGWQRFEGEALISTNALGFRDQDHPQAKPEDVLRIAVLGDSFTEAVQVPLDQTWWRLMGESLNKGFCASDSTIPLTVTGADAEPMPTARAEPEAELGQPAVDVLNFAVSGYSTAQSLLAWRHIAQAFSPDIVVLAFFIGNDLNENSRPLDNEPLRPYLIAEETGLTWDDRFLFSADYRSARSVSGRLWQWLREHSRILQLVLQARDALRMASFAAPQESSAAPGSKAAQMAEAQ
ncbi:SGNH/GDSL hydrolase family protein, partial [Halochromatium sp.]